MTKEQEAIEMLEDIKNSTWTTKYIMSSDSAKAETVLNMLKEKDIQINSRNGAINALQCALKERTEERDRKDNIITRQNKQIDLMARAFKQDDVRSVEEIKQYFEKISRKEE